MYNNRLSGCFPPNFKKLCDTITISEPNKPIRKIKPRVNFFNNPLVSWKGEFDMFCATDGSLAAQRGASCENGNPTDGNIDVIDDNCNCLPGCITDFSSISGPDNVCAGTSATLTINGGTIFNWQNGSTSKSITVTPTVSTNYVVLVTNQNGCHDTLTKRLTVFPSAFAKISGSTEICPGGNTTLSASGGVSYVWSNGSKTITANINAAGIYVVTVTDSNGCTGRDSVTVITLDVGKQPIPKDDTLYVEEDIIYDLDLLANDVLYTQNNSVRYGKNPGNDVRFTLQSADGKVKVTADRRFTEVVTLTYEICDQCDRCASAKLFILPEKLKNIIQTTLITPLESSNRTLQFSDGPISDSELWVYNRWGQQVFHAKDYQNDWNADDVPGGVYYYVFKVYGFTIKKALMVVK